MQDTSVTVQGSQIGQASRHYNLGGTETTLIPVADATGTPFESEEVSGTTERSYFTVLLWNAGAPLTTDTGTITIQGRASMDSHWQDINNGTFNASDLSDATRVQPAASGPMRQWRLLLTGTTTATHVSAFVDKYV